MNHQHRFSAGRGQPLIQSEAMIDALGQAARVIEPADALEAFRVHEDGILAEVPHALDAYLDVQRRNPEGGALR